MSAPAPIKEVAISTYPFIIDLSKGVSPSESVMFG
jgi:hypothetical protein